MPRKPPKQSPGMNHRPRNPAALVLPADIAFVQQSGTVVMEGRVSTKGLLERFLHRLGTDDGWLLVVGTLEAVLLDRFRCGPD